MRPLGTDEEQATLEEDEKSKGFEGPAILELLGHRRLVGYVSEAQIAGSTFLRIDIPVADGETMTQYYNPASLYGLTPCDEDTAELEATDQQVDVVNRYRLRPVIERETQAWMEAERERYADLQKRYERLSKNYDEQFGMRAAAVPIDRDEEDDDTDGLVF